MARSITCTYDLEELTSATCVITDVSRPLLTDWVLNTQEVPGRDGVRFLGQRRGPFDIAVTFAMWEDDPDDIQPSIVAFSEKIASATPKFLVFSDQDPMYYLAIPQGVTDLEQLDATTVRFTVNFHVPDGYLHGESNVSQASAGSSASCPNNGTAACPATITVERASGQYTFSDTRGNFCTVTCPSTAAKLVIDAENGVVTHNDVPLMMDLSSDFIYLQPGNNSIYETTGSSEFSVLWEPRW